MDPITQQGLAGSAGAGGDPVYVEDVFSTFLYPSNNSSTQTINNGIDLSGEGGLVWLKNRDSNAHHGLFDTERGAAKLIKSSDTGAEQNTSIYSLQSFNSNGYTLGGNWFGENISTERQVSWTFRKARGFFDIVTWTGNGSSSRQISHNLGSTPGMIIIKRTDASTPWIVVHRSLASVNNNYLYLNENSAESTGGYLNGWDSTSFTLGSYNTSQVNANTGTFVAYLFAHDDQSFGTDEDEAIVKCGTFNSDSSGYYTVSLGFEPQFLLIKSTSSGDWFIADTMRRMTMGSAALLLPNTTNANNIYTGEGYLYPTPDGFKSTRNLLGSSQTFIYMAIRRPHKPPTAGTEVFAMDTGSSSSTIPTWDSGFTVDMAINHFPNSGAADNLNSARLLGEKYLVPNKIDAEADGSDFAWDSNVGWGKSYNFNAYSYMYRRAPGFLDVVTYTGTGSTQNINHNLESVPELIICKARNVTFSWTIYNSGSGASKYLRFNNILASTSSSTWNNTAPTSSVFTVGSDSNTNHFQTNYIAYLFASLDGISKIGTFSGTGNNINVDCGFTAGARFVLIKRTDATADWYIWDTFRGIASGNDPYFLLNSYAAQVTNTDYIDPLNAGFTVTSSAPAGINASGGTYLYLAIA